MLKLNFVYTIGLLIRITNAVIGDSYFSK